MGKTLEAQGDPFRRGLPTLQTSLTYPELPCTATAGLGAKTFLAFWTAVAVQGSFWNSAGGARDLQSAASRSFGGRNLGTRVRDCIAVNK